MFCRLKKFTPGVLCQLLECPRGRLWKPAAEVTVLSHKTSLVSWGVNTRQWCFYTHHFYTIQRVALEAYRNITGQDNFPYFKPTPMNHPSAELTIEEKKSGHTFFPSVANNVKIECLCIIRGFGWTVLPSALFSPQGTHLRHQGDEVAVASLPAAFRNQPFP